MRTIEIVGEEWRFGPVLVADSFGRRLRGITAIAEHCGILIRGRSVHGFWMRAPVRAVGLGEDLAVVGVSLLPPGGLVVFRTARWVLEMPAPIVPPSPGTVLRFAPRPDVS